MTRRKGLATLFASIAAIATVVLVAGCAWPTHDPWKLRRIRDEARMLMKTNPVDADGLVPEARWQREIAGLKPMVVRIDADGILIVTRIYFDDSWGYFVPRSTGRLPKRVDQVEEVGEGIYWWHLS